MKRFGQIAGLLGLATLIVLVAIEGWRLVYSAIGQAGWALLWLLPFHVLPLMLDVFGWRVLLSPRDPRRHATIPILFWIATIREASNRLLPLANIGGEIIGIRLLKWRGVNAAAAAASVVMEVLLTVVNQYFFIGLGIVLLAVTTARTGALDSALIALAFSLPVPIALIALLRYGGMFSRLESLARKLLTGNAARLTEMINGFHLDLEIRALYARPARMLAAGIWQLLGLIVGSFENWLILRLLGHPVGAADAVALEALTQAVRHIFFVVPAALGIQEGGLILLGNMIGLPADISVALSLVKRMREIVFGVPALISWQWAEVHRLRTQWRDDARRHTSGNSGSKP
ncbi:MAG: lysylphosphatidylglycerol synthase domain-containing protein [Rhodanobacteraceae bacterium]